MSRGPDWRGLGKSKVPIVSAVREATAEDIERLRQQPKLAEGRIKKLKDVHHQLAILFAVGYTNVEIRDMTGRGLNSVSAFRNDPMMQELVAEYRPMVLGKAIDGEAERIASKHRVARIYQREIEQRAQDMIEGGEPVSQRDMQTYLQGYDRQFGPVEIKANVNINGTLEGQMERGWDVRMAEARERSRRPPKVIEHQLVETLAGNPSADLRLGSAERMESPSNRSSAPTPDAALERINRRF